MGQHAPDIKTFSVGYDIGCEDKLAEINALPDFDIKLNELDDRLRRVGEAAELAGKGRRAGVP